jgi:hypothetical protein
MSWKSRVKEIAKSNPEALHPIFRSALGVNGGYSWYRVEWQTQGSNKVPLENAIRPLITILEWMLGRGLLAKEGCEVLRKARIYPSEQMGLTSSMVSARAANFLNHCFEQWYEKFGIPLSIDAKGEKQAIEGLDAAWSSQRSDKGA